MTEIRGKNLENFGKFDLCYKEISKGLNLTETQI